MRIESNGVVLNSRTVLASSVGALNIRAQVPIEPQQLYTMVMTDPDAPYPQQGIVDINHPAHLHWLVVNIRGQLLQGGQVQGNTLASYMPPNPPADSPPHRYFVDIYLQEYPLALSPLFRPGFNLSAFTAQQQLHLIDEAVFRAGQRV